MSFEGGYGSAGICLSWGAPRLRAFGACPTRGPALVPSVDRPFEQVLAIVTPAHLPRVGYAHTGQVSAIDRDVTVRGLPHHPPGKGGTLSTILIKTDAHRRVVLPGDEGNLRYIVTVHADGSMLLQPAVVKTQAQELYDTSSELRDLLSRAAAAPTVKRPRGTRRTV